MDFSGMTLNERLFEAKLLKEFDSAVEQKDKERLINILTKVDISGDEAEKTVTTILENPQDYGNK